MGSMSFFDRGSDGCLYKLEVLCVGVLTIFKSPTSSRRLDSCLESWRLLAAWGFYTASMLVELQGSFKQFGQAETL